VVELKLPKSHSINLEYWNDGILEYWASFRKLSSLNVCFSKPIIPLLQCSITPLFFFVPMFLDRLDRLVNMERVSKIEAFLF
jgi:hypothetical protein